MSPITKSFIIGTLTDWRVLLMVSVIIVLGLWAVVWGDCYRQQVKK